MQSSASSNNKFDSTDDNSETEIPERGAWSGRFDSLVCMINYGVGIGNVWRFSYLCFKHGGGAFLIPYCISWLCCGLPIYYLEVYLGQYLQRGGLGIWKICPIFKGVGISNIMISCVCTTYFCVLSTWAWYFMFSSFRSTLPWLLCNQIWTDNYCFKMKDIYDNTTIQGMLQNRNLTFDEVETSVEQFWENRVLDTTDGITLTSGLVWELLLLLILCWMITYFALWKGLIHSKILIYTCAIVPYFLLFILLGRSLSLEGAGNGIMYYLTPNVTKLMSTTVWKDAGSQVFYSCGLGYGAIMAIGSYNRFNHNSGRDCVIMCIINASTSLISGLVTFGVLGYMAAITHKKIEDVVKPGIGLAFLVYPEALGLMPIPQLWSVLFFMMLGIIGLNSQICMVEGLVTSLTDEFPNVLRKYKRQSVLVFCVTFCFLGFSYISRSGQFWLTLVDNYGAAGTPLFFIVFFEVVGMCYGFGVSNISAVIETMIGVRPTKLWYVGWLVTAPLVTLIGFLAVTVHYVPLKYSDDTLYPQWALTLGWFMSLSSMVPIPLYAIYYLAILANGSLLQRMRQGITSTIQHN